MNMKLYCLEPFGIGPDSYFVMAESEAAALDAIYAFQADPENNNYRFAVTRGDFDDFLRCAYKPIMACHPGKVLVTPNQ